MEEPGVQPVLGALPQLQERRSLRDVIQGESSAPGKNLLSTERQPVLQRLRLHRTDDAKPHRGGGESPQMVEKINVPGVVAADFEKAR